MSEVAQRINEVEQRIIGTRDSLETYQDGDSKNTAAQFMLQMELANLETELERLQALERQSQLDKFFSNGLTQKK